jgi:hypothetical protein
MRFDVTSLYITLVCCFVLGIFGGIIWVFATWVAKAYR